MNVKATPETTTMSAEGIKNMDLSRFTNIDIDLNTMPDVSMTYFILALFLPGKTHVTGLHTLNKKECRRLEAMGTEIQKLGVDVSWTEEDITIGELDVGAWADHEPVEIKTYHDHRVAMCFGILNAFIGKLDIMEPSCVAKTYPRFWEDLKKYAQ